MNRYARLAMKAPTREAVASGIFGRKLTRPVTAGVRTMFNKQRLNGPNDVRDLLTAGKWTLGDSAGLSGFLRTGFGDADEISSALTALRTAEAAVRTWTSKRTAQLALIAATERAVKGCAEDAPNIIGNILSAGATAAVCLAAQNTALGQRKGVLADIEYNLTLAKTELKAAQINYADAKARGVTDVSVSDLPSPGTSPGSSERAAQYLMSDSARGRGSEGEAEPLWKNPFVIGGAVLAVGGIALVLLKKR